MKKLITLLLGIALSSCATNQYIPLENKLRQIENIPYNRKHMNCTHKTHQYRTLLEEKGIKSRLVLGYVGKSNTLHMWLEAYNKENKTWHMIDATDKTTWDGFEPKEYGNREILWRVK